MTTISTSEPASSLSRAAPKTVTLYVCSPRRQIAEPIHATPDMTLRDVVGLSENLWWSVRGDDLDRVTVCVSGVPRHINDRLGGATTVEVYPPRALVWYEG
jgi:hypothetical protein